MEGVAPGGSSEELDCLDAVLVLGLAPPEAGLAEVAAGMADRAAVGTFALAVARTAEGAVDTTIGSGLRFNSLPRSSLLLSSPLRNSLPLSRWLWRSLPRGSLPWIRLWLGSLCGRTRGWRTR